MNPIQSLGASPFFNLCLYGAPGVGKTRFVGSGKDTLIIRPPTDHTDSIRGGASRNIKEWVVRSWDDLTGAHDSVQAYLTSEGHKWDIVAFDSISLFQDTGLDSIWQQVIAEKPHRARYGLDKQEYGINMHRLSVFVRDIVGLEKFNFIVTAHPFWGENIDGDSLLMPYVQGKNMTEKIAGCMNMVGYMEVKTSRANGKTTKKRIINFDSSDRYYAKDQFDAFEKGRLLNPTMPKLLEAVEAARSRESAAKPKPKKRKAN